ncbi:glycosyltransferase [Kribbella sp. NPDC051587]|uniref:glycosyltransferase n=1 Tax=Kribbella sp. NPDC051587 TaxID=3364119 RepID=UPI00379631A5
MKILFMPYPSTSGTWGCTVYMYAIAYKARQQGHDVLFHACAPSSRLIADGFPVASFAGADPAESRRPIADIYDVFHALGLDHEGYYHYLIRAESEVIDRYQPDVIVADMRPSATISAYRTGTPLVCLASAATDPRWPVGPESRPLDDLALRLTSRYGGPQITRFPELLYWTADRKIATSFPEFEPELRNVQGLDYVGYLDSPQREQPIADADVPRGLVLAYLSTVGWSSPRLIDSVARTVERLGMTLWCVTNARGAAGSLATRSRVFDYLPLNTLLPRAEAILFHGGQGTALASVYHAVPSIVCPGDNYERRYNAARIADLGCGVFAETRDLRPARLVDLLSTIVDDAAFNLSAAAASTKLLAQSGPAGALRVVERAAG